jgi:hypothetical protein
MHRARHEPSAPSTAAAIRSGHERRDAPRPVTPAIRLAIDMAQGVRSLERGGGGAGERVEDDPTGIKLNRQPPARPAPSAWRCCPRLGPPRRRPCPLPQPHPSGPRQHCTRQFRRSLVRFPPHARRNRPRAGAKEDTAEPSSPADAAAAARPRIAAGPSRSTLRRARGRSRRLALTHA